MPGGFFDSISKAVGGGKKTNYVRLTDVGKKRLEDLEVHSSDYAILSAINRHSPCDVTTVVKDPEIKFEYAQVRDTMNRFYTNQWITDSQ